MTTPQWLEVCAVDDIPMLGSRVVRRTQGADVALFRNADNEVFALLDRCPHKGGALSQGIVFGRKVACPLHNWNIQLDCGEAVAPDHGCAPSFAVRVHEGRVFLNASELATIGLALAPPAWPQRIRLAT
jgi:nitrite reductase (NADH) small subunit